MPRLGDEMKTLAIIAHDLKAPLSAVVNLLSIIEKGYVDDPKKVIELISRARNKSQTLVKMVDDIIDYIILENKTIMQREKLNIYSIIEESVSIMTPFAMEKNVQLHFEQDKFNDTTHSIVIGNFTFLLRAFNNVIMNAIKYNKDQGSIRIACRKDNEEHISIKIQDTGIGIPEDELKHVFTIFRRGKVARKNIDGSIGLGLALVKQIINDHEGSIDIASMVGVGTTIIINLPILKKEET